MSLWIGRIYSSSQDTQEQEEERMEGDFGVGGERNGGTGDIGEILYHTSALSWRSAFRRITSAATMKGCDTIQHV